MPFKGESGVKITARTGIDISTATALRLYYQKPNGESGYWTAAVETPTSISYTTKAGDLNCTGTFKVQAFAVIDSHDHYGTIAKISVTGTLK